MRVGGVLLILAGCALAAPVAAQEKQAVTAGPEYKATSTLRRWFGDGYRDVWTTPFEAPVLDLGTEAGGLEPVRQVGGLQTAGLAMRGADGRSYTFRSLHKEPERLLPAEWRGSWPAKLLRDATSATHPGAAVMLPVLAEAAGVPHTQPRLVVMPDDPKLGAFRGTFANKVGTFEEYPTGASAAYPGFEGASAIIPTATLWTRWLQTWDNHPDSRAYLRARILDLFVDNYDRRRGQWRWMQLPGKTGWQVLPEDPDMVFVRHNGLLISSMRARQPRLLEFSAQFPSSLEGPTSIAEVDRWLLADLDAPVYEQLARELQAAWTDAVIERTVAQLPEPWRALDKGFLVGAMKARRDALGAYVQRFYRQTAGAVDVHLTDQDERVLIATGADRATTVTVTAGTAGAPVYQRTFRPADTSEVRVYVHGGADRLERTGTGGGIHVRIIADGGTKTVDSPGTRTEVWADEGQLSGQKVSRHDPWTNPEPVTDGPWLEPRNSGSLTLWQPIGWIAPDIGVVVGATVTRTSYGFRSVPAAKVQTLGGGWAFGDMSGKIAYDGIFRRPASPTGFGLALFASGIEHLNFFGTGNETAEVSRSAYRSPQTLFSVAPTLRFGSSAVSFTVGPQLRYSKSGEEAGTVLAEQSPYGTGDFGLIAFRASIEADTRPKTAGGLLAVATGATNGEAVDAPPGRGMRVVGSTFIAPSVWDVTEKYGGVDGWVAAYAGTPSVQFGARIGGARLFGDYPWFDAAFLGGGTDRGYRSHRFAGDASLYANVELRTYLGHPVFQSIFPVRFGLVGFVDDGRVWVSGEDSRAWHPSAGGGVLLKPVGTTILLRAIVAQGREGTLFYAGSGFRF